MKFIYFEALVFYNNMFLKLIFGVIFSLVLVCVFGMPIVSEPTRWYQLPNIQGLGDKVRIIFFHVPIAWVTVIAFLSSLLSSFRYLITKNIYYDIKSVTAAELGFLFCILATITGAIWAKFSWGVYWNWDPRQTSIFILLLIYGAYFALRSSIENEEKKSIISAVYSILAGISVPFFIFIIPRVVASLHPAPIINLQAKLYMNLTIFILFILSLLCFTILYFWIFKLKIHLLVLENKIQSIERN